MASAQPQGFDQQLKGRRRGRFWRGLGFASLFTVGALTLYGTLTQSGRNLTQVVIDGAPVAKEVLQNPNLIFDNVGDSHVNILLIGEDRNWKQGEVFNPKTGKFAPMNVVDEDTPPRSDTMIVVSLDRTDPNKPAIRMVSFPRDARVRFTDLDGKKHKATKMNSVYATGGTDPKKREQVLRNFFHDELGLRIDRVARIRIEGFTKLIDRVGGLNIDVDGALKHKHGNSGPLIRKQPIFYEDKWGQWKVELNPGMQHLNGTQAVGYARYRYDVEGDPGRIRRQQQVMRALAKEIMSQPIYQLPGVVKEARQQFATDMTDEELASMALFAKNSGADAKIQPMTVFGASPTTGNMGDIILNKPQNVKLFSYIFGSSFDATKFLKRSPETTQDELGFTNNRSPAALEILREAGILSEKDLTKPKSVSDAP